jgi:hypothetical protein
MNNQLPSSKVALHTKFQVSVVNVIQAICLINLIPNYTTWKKKTHFVKNIYVITLQIYHEIIPCATVRQLKKIQFFRKSQKSTVVRDPNNKYCPSGEKYLLIYGLQKLCHYFSNSLYMQNITKK